MEPSRTKERNSRMSESNLIQGAMRLIQESPLISGLKWRPMMELTRSSFSNLWTCLSMVPYLANRIRATWEFSKTLMHSTRVWLMQEFFSWRSITLSLTCLDWIWPVLFLGSASELALASEIRTTLFWTNNTTITTKASDQIYMTKVFLRTSRIDSHTERKTIQIVRITKELRRVLLLLSLLWCLAHSSLPSSSASFSLGIVNIKRSN